MAITATLILAFSVFQTVLMAETPQCDTRTDIVFIMDSSGSVGSTGYGIMLNFTVNITRNFEVGNSKVQFGAIVFSQSASKVFNLNTYSHHFSLEQAILSTPYQDGPTTYTNKALELARTSAFTAASGARYGVPKISVVFTDGKSNNAEATEVEAKKLKAAGVKVISIGIGDSVDHYELELIASSQEDVFEVTGFDVLDTINQRLTNQVCNLGKEACSCADITSKLKGMEEKLDMLVAFLKVQEHSDEFYDIMNTGNKEWRLAFRGTPYIKKSVYEAYQSDSGAHSNVEPECKQLDGTLTCRNHYRNSDVLDNWADIDEVALVLYLGKTQVKHMIFDGQGSTYMDWMSQDRLKLSSWDDAKNETYNFFSIEGDSNLCRRFFANHNYGECPNDAGWFAAVDVASGAQAWESSERLPVFKYSKEDTYTNWTTGDVGMASILAIFVKYTTGGIVG